MDIYKKYFGDIRITNSKPTLSLFKDDNENGGIFIKANFIPELQAAGKKQPSFVAHTKKLIDLMHAKRFFATEPQEGFESGMKVIWCHFRYGKMNVRLCVPNINGIVELIENYQHNRIVVNVDFDELMRQAAGEPSQSK